MGKNIFLYHIINASKKVKKAFMIESLVEYWRAKNR